MGILDIFKKRIYSQVETHSLIKASFANVKRDTALLFQWVNYINQKLQQQEELFYHLQGEISNIPKTKESIREAIDSYYSNIGILDKLKTIEQRIDNLYIQKPSTEKSEELKSIIQRLDSIEQKRQGIKQKLIQRLARNSKDYLKSVILSLIRKYEKISAQKLREIVVEEQALCSKSSFYRFLEEIEKDDTIGVIKTGKEKSYLSKLKISQKF